MKKKSKNVKILEISKRASNFNKQYTWGEVKEKIKAADIKLRNTDELNIYYSEGFDHGDSSCDPSYDVSIWRTRLETDKEFKERKKITEELKKESYKKRLEQFLKLKEEFEPTVIPEEPKFPEDEQAMTGENLSDWLNNINGSLSDNEYDRVRNLLGQKIVKEFCLHDEDNWVSWQTFGGHKNVMNWVLLESGHGVGLNENPGRGLSFPCQKVPQKVINLITKKLK